MSVGPEVTPGPENTVANANAASEPFSLRLYCTTSRFQCRANANKKARLYSSTFPDTRGTAVNSYSFLDALPVVQPSPCHRSPVARMVAASAGFPIA